MTERELLERSRIRLAELLEHRVTEHSKLPLGVDALWTSGEQTFLVEAKSSASTAHIEQGIRHLLALRTQSPGAIPLLVVPTMGPGGIRLAQETGCSWLDLGGQADIKGRTLRILVSREKPAAKAPRSNAGAFGRRASSLVHALLLHPKSERDASELARESHLDNGYVTKILDTLVEDGYVSERRVGRRRIVSVSEPNALLTAWDEHYQRSRPIAFALLATRDGFATEQRITNALFEAQIPYTITALAAAAEYSRFGAFRRVTVYVRRSALESRSFDWALDADARGRNVAFIEPAGASDVGTREMSGRTYVSPVLTYLDLAAESERAEEARTAMKRVIEELWT